MSQFTRKNHYIPQFYLKQWANSESKVWEHKFLVSHKNVPDWELVSVKESAGFHRDLYTGLINNTETDEIENWYNYNIELPAQVAIEKTVRREKIDSQDMRNLIRFVAAQYLRTPAGYFRGKEVFENNVKAEISKDFSLLTKESVEYIEEPGDANKYKEFAKWLPMRIQIDKSDNDSNLVKFQITTGFTRNTWHFLSQTLLNRTYNCLLEHDWRVIEAASGVDLYTSDDPVVFLNYYGSDKYDFKGGWGREHGNAFFPLSPRYFLFTEMGVDLSDLDVKNNLLFTYMMQRITIEHAFRSIYSLTPKPSLMTCRNRIVDEIKFKEEAAIWKNWNSIQIEMEKEFK